jgi:hypothetical protein
MRLSGCKMYSIIVSMVRVRRDHFPPVNWSSGYLILASHNTSFYVNWIMRTVLPRSLFAGRNPIPS